MDHCAAARATSEPTSAAPLRLVPPSNWAPGPVNSFHLNGRRWQVSRTENPFSLRGEFRVLDPHGLQMWLDPLPVPGLWSLLRLTEFKHVFDEQTTGPRRLALLARSGSGLRRVSDPEEWSFRFQVARHHAGALAQRLELWDASGNSHLAQEAALVLPTWSGTPADLITHLEKTHRWRPVSLADLIASGTEAPVSVPLGECPLGHDSLQLTRYGYQHYKGEKRRRWRCTTTDGTKHVFVEPRP